jgi:predicted transcriptional regulator of viral defense system
MERKMPDSLKNKTFTLREARELGVNRYQLQRLIESNFIEKVNHGQYRDAALIHDPEADYVIATRIVGKPSSICLLSALSYHQLTDTIPKKVWVLVPQSTRSRSARLKLVRRRNPYWKVGITNEKNYSITNIERTIVESILLHRLIGKNEALQGLKRALRNKKTTIQKIYNVARQLDAEAKVQPYLEALAP